MCGDTGCPSCGTAQGTYGLKEEEQSVTGPGQLPPAIEKACDSVDAVLFTGDSFRSAEAIERMEWYMGRWQRELAVCKLSLEQAG
jgi:hypothetical protein